MEGNNIEEWRAVYDKYEVSNLGRLRNSKGKILSDKSLTNGYIKNCLHVDGKAIYRGRHKLVAIAWLGHTPCGYEEVVDHIDRNPLNNNVNNLQRTTARNNVTTDRGGVSDYVGVMWSKQHSNWKVCIRIHGREYSLGHYSDEKFAAKQYTDALSAYDNWGIIPKIWKRNERRNYKPQLNYINFGNK